MDNLQIIISESDRCKGAGGDHRDPDKPVTEVCPQQSRHDRRDSDQKAAHGGRASFFLMGLGSFLANVLADLKFAEPANDKRTHDQSREQGCEAGKSCSKSKIAKNSKRREIVKKLQIK